MESRLRRLPLWVAALLAAVGGYALTFAFPSHSMWWMAPVGVSLISASVWHQRARHGLWIGGISGATFWLPLISWLTLYLGPVPWLALGSVMISWCVLFGGLAAWVTERLSSRSWSRWPVVLLQSCIVAGLWVTREQVQSSWPYGGFGWGRLAHTQADGPWIAVVSWTGFAGLTGIIALAAIFPIAGAFSLKGRISKTVPLLISVVAAIVLGTIPPALLPSHGERRIAAVQGNSKSGVFDDRESGDVFAAHERVTRAWIDADPEPVDAVIWPENSGEFMLPQHHGRLATIQDLMDETGAAFSIGTILQDRTPEGDVYTNSSIILQPDTPAIGRYDKRFPVPFAEFMPHRAFYRSLVPHLVDLVVLDYQPGTTPSVVMLGDMRAGHAICFDIVFDVLAQDMVDSGAEVIIAPTNNADFGFTDQSEQQVAIARLRAVETGRDLVHISTVATSAVISRSGEMIADIPQWEEGVMVASVELVSGATPAVAFGSWIAAGWIVAGVGGTVFCRLVPLKSRRQPARYARRERASGYA